jgi:ATP-dependent DNA helicase RecQ
MEFNHAEWMSIARQLIHRGYLVQDIAAYSVLKLTPQALVVLRGEETVELARPRIRAKAPKKEKLPAGAVRLEGDDVRVFERLRALRKRLAEENGVPPYVVFGDATLIEMSHLRPSSEEELLAINGVGQVKLERYGPAFLGEISSVAEERAENAQG